MSSPIELLREGILSGSWERVCEGFAGLTGMGLKPPAQQPADDSVALRGLLVAIHSQIESALEGDEFILTPAFKEAAEIEAQTPIAAGSDEVEEEEAAPAPAPKPMPAPTEADPETARARELKANRAGNRVDPDQFKIQHNAPTRPDGKKACRSLPHEKGMVNKFVDDGKLARNDIALDKKMSGKLQPSERRPEVPKVEVQCCKCKKTEQVDPIFAPKKLGPDDETNYVCNSCIGRVER